MHQEEGRRRGYRPTAVTRAAQPKPPAAANTMPPLRSNQLTPASEWTAEQVDQAEYGLGNLAGPPLTGAGLVLYRVLSEGALTATAIFNATLARNKVDEVRRAWWDGWVGGVPVRSR